MGLRKLGPVGNKHRINQLVASFTHLLRSWGCEVVIHVKLELVRLLRFVAECAEEECVGFRLCRNRRIVRSMIAVAAVIAGEQESRVLQLFVCLGSRAVIKSHVAGGAVNVGFLPTISASVPSWRPTVILWFGAKLLHAESIGIEAVE